MKKVVRKILSLSCICAILFTSNIYANKIKEEDAISTTLEQPAVYSVKPGEELEYKQIIELPKEYEKKYKAFAITIRMDPDLDIQKAELLGFKEVKDKLAIIINKSDKVDQNTITLSVNDLKVLNKKEKFELVIKAKVKKGMKGDNLFTNSFILAYTSIDGKEEVENQKDLTSNTKKTNGLLKVTNQIYDNTKEIKGQTEKNSNIKVFLADKVIAQGKSDNNGNYTIKIQPLEEGTHLKVVSYFNDDKSTKIADEELIVEKNIQAESIIDNSGKDNLDSEKDKEEIKKDTESEKQRERKYNKSTLRDYISMAKDLNTKNAEKEDSARLKAAVANGDYIKVKSKVTTDDYEEAINKIIKASSMIRNPFMNGYDETSFGAEDPMTRAQAATVIARIINKKDPKGEFSSFKDVDQNKWYSEAVAFMEKEDLLKGYEDGSFKPNKNITRAEFTSIIAKIIEDEGKYSPKEFIDVKRGFWAEDSINLITSLKLMNGRENNKFAPNDPIKRVEVATVLNKLLEREPNKEFMNKYSNNPFKDLKKDYWGYYEILEATGN